MRSQTLNYYFCDLNLFLWLNLLWLLVPLVKMIFLSLLHPFAHIFVHLTIMIKFFLLVLMAILHIN